MIEQAASGNGAITILFHAQRLGRAVPEPRRMAARVVRNWFIIVAIALCGCTQKTVLTSSMSPTIKPGAKVTVDWTAYALSNPKRWDVICFEPPMYTNQIWAMRVVALPGEVVSFATGNIAINGRPIALPSHITNVTYVTLAHPALQAGGGGIASPYVVPSNSFFVLGDNSIKALDSRFWGAVQRTNVHGKVRGI